MKLAWAALGISAVVGAIIVWALTVLTVTAEVREELDVQDDVQPPQPTLLIAWSVQNAQYWIKLRMEAGDLTQYRIVTRPEQIRGVSGGAVVILGPADIYSAAHSALVVAVLMRGATDVTYSSTDQLMGIKR